MNRVAVSVLLALGLASAVSAKDLVGVYEDATHNDPQIRAADANRLAQREARPQAWAALLPQINGTGSWTRDKSSIAESSALFNPTIVPPTQLEIDSNTTSKKYGATLQQTVFSWASLMSLKAADSTVAEAEATYHAAEQNLMIRVAQAYFTVLTDEDNLDANEASLEAISRQLDQANKRFEVGLIAVTDVEEAKAAHDRAAANVIAAKRALATANDQLAEITGQKYDSLDKPGDNMPLNNPVPASEDAWVTTSMDQNLTLVASRLAADVARENVRVAFGGHLPTINFVASHTHSDQSGDESFFGSPPISAPETVTDNQFGFQISIPIFAGGGTQSKVRQAQYEWIAAKETVVQNSRATERSARDAYLGVISGIAQVQALRQALESDQTALKATEAGYEVGTRTSVDVLNARQTLVQGQTDYASSRYNYLLSILQLRQAAGTLNPKDLQEINGSLNVPGKTTPAQPLGPASNSGITAPAPQDVPPAPPVNPTPAQQPPAQTPPTQQR
ncbi:MAG TPA: TolC family outer membrane protein [Steroidobacteraceae bacterium]|nr:TolC family outer membrane protein [Steroidobacteraceae bacterium]